MTEFSLLAQSLPPELYTINPDEQWSVDELCETGTSESWNLDEFSEEGYMALKHLFLRTIVPKEHWRSITYEKFLGLVKEKYKERLNEEI